MKHQLFLSQTPSPHSQRGIATILIVVLIGVALTATAMSIMHSIRSTQEKHIAVHAATNAQVGAWAGVEAFRRYLATLDGATLDTGLPAEMSLTLGTGGDSYGSMAVKDVFVTDAGDSYRVKATIINTLDAARASAAVGVVYEVGKVDDCPGCVMLTAALDFHDDLIVGGGISITMPDDALPTINVDGDVEMMNLAPMSLGVLNSTGSVSLDSNMRVAEINSNDNVRLTGDARADKVTTRGTVFTDGSGGARIIWANGSVTLGGTYRSDAVNSRSNVSINRGQHGDVKTIGNVTVGAATKIDEVQTKADTIINNNAEVTRIIGEGNLRCGPLAREWSNFTSISINGIVDPSCHVALQKSNANDGSASTGASNSVTEMNEVAEITIPRMVVDVWTLKQYANYVFEWDSSVNRTKVTVKDIGEVPDGEYWVGNYADNKRDYLCKTFVDGKCATPAATLQSCIGHSEYNNCLTPAYNTTNKTWTFDGKHALPGVLWFKGNVYLNNGYNYSTVLATGDVKTGGQMRIESVNYAGFNAMCKAEGIDGTYKTTFEDQFPKNLCNMAEGKYIPMDVGNIAIAAGGYDPADNGTYSGGNIDVGANNKIYGVVLAGDYLETGGQTEIYGYVSAAVQGERGANTNKLGGSTTLDLTHGNENYDPAKVPDMAGGACPDCDDVGGSETGTTKVLWSKYL